MLITVFENSQKPRGPRVWDPRNRQSQCFVRNKKSFSFRAVANLAYTPKPISGDTPALARCVYSMLSRHRMSTSLTPVLALLSDGTSRASRLGFVSSRATSPSPPVSETDAPSSKTLGIHRNRNRRKRPSIWWVAVRCMIYIVFWSRWNCMGRMYFSLWWPRSASALSKNCFLETKSQVNFDFE